MNVLLVPQGLSGLGGGGGAPYPYTELGFFPHTNMSASISLATIAGGTIPVGATFALVTCLIGNMNWRGDGPAASAEAGGGQPLYIGQALIVAGPQLATTKFIQQSADAILCVSFFL